MNVTETKIKDLLILEPKMFADSRGWFMESFNQKTFHAILTAHNQPTVNFVQDNHSISHRGVIRGLHYQINPYAQGKLVRVVSGKAWDVAVDIRSTSPTFGQWVGIELSEKNHRQFWIPAGFAHGFIALEDNTQFLYKTTNYYSKECERSLLWNDSDLAINWPIEDNMLINQTDKDNTAPSFKELINNNIDLL
ncbi:dTDP-4-dehydrorhamnose 3,5-epimerase [Snodgrassella communis]|jgi:dTDP-4-dehydrorhamnose 3,5-epimerase|uniref:dTDP-4-dehydrorhamnose 3,5-epimerase n=1 Tax=Snodgrassella communis TaxID=2946699 RepID=A0A066TC03_9NEIS|nr:dTDP-4-dehydrorhamnose 3,5-epimerase [Snodgrassella communis]KDN12380.1 dTDP-4-dehydrorhamnose 3,5-epimerase [Snodgrassella communis]KDN14882.1 dTDP-4-dehydrorhamnose 3,5-epimerase [Snodgrassella communis]PIT08686.1 dTDP-4-dehydrorhamnose 3,5-epimerase [Snodgrassella communis]PIT29352.1 dTDP-4-dehydrorhamnose 3,5-epimerase [Snodgrassella communis]PIT29558.1 dTDP-4-dehydrorhamnose 3,5-epimerase [Snodgrassella communis]